MDLIRHLQDNSAFRRYLLKLLIVNFLFSVFVYFLLILIDSILVRIVIGYQTAGSYLLSASVFFLASLLCFYLAIKYHWNKLFPYFSVAIGVYFPLVTISTFIKIHIGLSPELTQVYLDNVCTNSNTATLCGEALAHLVLSTAVRALPLVLSLPYLYWLALNYLDINDPQVYLND